MSILILGKDIHFPPVSSAESDGILAVGGDLSPARLLEAYQNGIFPWYSEDEPIIWWSPDPRFVLFPDEIKITRSMRQVLKKNIYRVTCDASFREVITECGKPRKKERGTWITDEMLEAYCALHDLGYAHSVEAWREGSLAGGLYGVSLGRCFFGESMFTREPNASKVCLVTLSLKLKELGFFLIDSQVYTRHLASMGARHIPRDLYIMLVKKGLAHETLKGSWGKLLDQ